MMTYAPLLSVFVTLLLSYFLLSNKITKGITDVPNERSLHEAPIPRVGGLGLVAGILSGWLVLEKLPPLWMVVPLLFLFFLSLIDDVRGLSRRIRLAAHFIAAICVVWGGRGEESVLLSITMVLIIVWIVNLYNFMDGADGLAGGMALIGFSVYGVAALMGGGIIFAMTCFTVGAAALGFLFFNIYPAKLFLGDAGSITLGFLVAAIGIDGWHQGLWPMWFPAMVFSPFILDATVTLAKRAIQGEQVWLAHREHYYQRLVQLGLGHKYTAQIEYVLMITVGVSALWLLRHPHYLLLGSLAWGLTYLCALGWVDYCWKVSKRA